MHQHFRPALLWLALAWTALAPGAGLVEVTAELEFTAWRHQEETGLRLKTQRRVQVRCVTGTNLWHVENQVRSNVTERLWFLEGKIARQVTVKYDNEEDDAPVTYSGRRSARSVGMTASADGYPGGDGGVSTPWLAWCSGSYLRRPGRAVPLPVPGSDRAAFGFRDETTVFGDGLGLPRTILLRNGQGQLKAEYRVQQSTNVLGWNVPTAFTLTQNEADALGRWRPVVTVTGRAVQVRPVAGLTVPEEVRERLDMWDATINSRK